MWLRSESIGRGRRRGRLWDSAEGVRNSSGILCRMKCRDRGRRVLREPSRKARGGKRRRERRVLGEVVDLFARMKRALCG